MLDRKLFQGILQADKMTDQSPSVDKSPPKPWSVLDVFVVIAVLGLFGLGVYLSYRTYVGIGGFRGYFALLGRWLTQLLWVLAVFTAYLAGFALLHLVISVVTGTALRHVKIFISFQHDYEPIATEIAKALPARDIAVIKLPFTSGRDHDDVIAQSLDAVTSADAIVVVPGAEPSWMANELGHAVGSRKPIAVIKHLADQRLSDSLYRGYPVFGWDKLKSGGFAPLRRFLAFSTKSRSDVWPQFGRSLAGFGSFVIAGFFAWYVIAGLVKEVVQVLLAFNPRRGEVVFVYWIWGTFGLLALAFALGFTRAIALRVRGLAVARQKILTREATYSEFSTVFSSLKADKDILQVLEKAPLEPRPEEP